MPDLDNHAVSTGALRRVGAAIVGLAVLALAVMPLPARAAMKLEGDPGAMKVTVADVPRQRVVAVLASRLGLKVSGRIVAPREQVSGIFRGDLGEVLAGLLVANNFLIVYEGGKPSKVLLSEKGEAAAPVDPAMRAFQQGGGTVIGGVRYDDPNMQVPADPNAQASGQVQYMPPQGSGLGRPQQYDPDTGLPIDPATGLPMDPATGQPIDPATGLPVDMSAGQGN